MLLWSSFVFAQDFLGVFEVEKKNNSASYQDFLIPKNFDQEDIDKINKVFQKRTEEEKKNLVYILKKGETLWSVSKKFNLPLEKILEANYLTEKSVVKEGEKIVLPGIKPNVRLESRNSLTRVVGRYVSAMTKLGDLIVPVSGFNWGKKHSQNGSDIAAPCGSPVYSSQDGIVIESIDGWNSGYGNYIIIKHTNFYTLYGHLSLRTVEIGEKVQKGELVGYVGNTGYTEGPTGCHLHFEVRGRENPLLQ